MLIEARIYTQADLVTEQDLNGTAGGFFEVEPDKGCRCVNDGRLDTTLRFELAKPILKRADWDTRVSGERLVRESFGDLAMVESFVLSPWPADVVLHPAEDGVRFRPGKVGLMLRLHIAVVLEVAILVELSSARGFVHIVRGLHVEGLVGTLLVVDARKVIEGAPLGSNRCPRRASRFSLQRAVKAFVTTVLVRTAPSVPTRVRQLPNPSFV